MTRDVLLYLSENPGQLRLLVLQHLGLFALSLLPAALVGIALGLAAADPGRPRLGRILLSLSGAAQALPSVAVIALAFLAVGIGARPALIALFLYSLAPIVFNTTAGLLALPPATIQAARGMGLSRLQILWRVELPLALPVILAGLRSAATVNIGAATVASFIGGGGLGDLIFMGLKLYRPDLIFIGGAGCALLALSIDLILACAQRRANVKFLRAETAA